MWCRAARARAACLVLLAALWLLLLVRCPPRPAPDIPATADAKLGAVLLQSLYVAGHSRPHPELCPALGARTRLVILVSSAPANTAARETVRHTWGHAAQRARVALAFVLGAPPPALRAALDAEDALYGDLVEGRSVDSYSNLTLKTVSMLEWFDTYCPRAPRMLKTDDDMFINVPNLMKFVEDPARRNATNTVWGNVTKHGWVVRYHRHKYYVPPEQFPGKTYPDYTQGSAYLVTADAARRLLHAALGERYLRMEDVFVTGVLAARLGVRRVHASEFYLFVYGRKIEPHACALQHIVAIHMVQYLELFDLFQEVINGKTKCASNIYDNGFTTRLK